MSQVVIEELGGSKRTLTLNGAGLPFQGAEWGGDQVVDTVWNPGSSVAVQHVLGPKELPSDWEGEWNTTRLVASPCEWDDGTGGGLKSLVLADDVRNALDSIRMQGQLLRVTWTDKPNRRVGRYGRLTSAKFPTTRSDDIKWKATFEWIGRVDAGIAVVNSDQSVAAARAAALAATDAQSRIEAANFIASNPRVPNSASTFTLGALEQFAKAPLAIAQSFARAMTDVASRMRTLGGIINTARSLPQAIAEQFVDAALDAVGVANEFVDQMSRPSPETMSLQTDVKSLLRATTYYSGAQTGADLLAEQSMTAARAAQQRRAARIRPGADPRSLTGAGDILTVYAPKAGDTLIAISLRFYGVDLSYQLARANGLPGSTIFPPRSPALIIPTRAVIDALSGST